MGKEISPDLEPYKYTTSPEAYRYFILAAKASSAPTQLNLYSQAVAADSNFVPAIIFLSMRYDWLGFNEDAKKWCLKAYEKRDIVPIKERFMAEWYHATLFETPNEEIIYLKQYQYADDQVPVCYWQTGNAYMKLLQYDKAILEYEKALEIYKKWQVKPMMASNYTDLGNAYLKTGEYNKAEKIYRKAEKDFPAVALSLTYNRAILSLTEGDTIAANGYIEKFRSIAKGKSSSELDIAYNVARIYTEAGILDKAEEYHRKSLLLQPENPWLMDNLGYFLIDKDRNIKEGLELSDKALELKPDNYDFIHTKGWGLYKQGKYQEALELLQKSWDLRMKNAVYDHTAYLHLEKAKKVVLNQKQN